MAADTEKGSITLGLAICAAVAICFCFSKACAYCALPPDPPGPCVDTAKMMNDGFVKECAAGAVGSILTADDDTYWICKCTTPAAAKEEPK